MRYFSSFESELHKIWLKLNVGFGRDDKQEKGKMTVDKNKKYQLCESDLEGVNLFLFPITYKGYF